MNELVFFLNEGKEDDKYHLFKGQYIGVNIGFHEKYSLCNQADKEQCIEPVIKNQTQETMQFLCEKTKRNVCQYCLSLLKKCHF